MCPVPMQRKFQSQGTKAERFHDLKLMPSCPNIWPRVLSRWPVKQDENKRAALYTSVCLYAMR